MITLIALVLTCSLSCTDKAEVSKNTQADPAVELVVGTENPVDAPESVTEKQVNTDEVGIKTKQEKQPVDGVTYQTPSLDEGFEKEAKKNYDVSEKKVAPEKQVGLDSSSAIIRGAGQSEFASALESEGLKKEIKADHSAFDDLLRKYVSASGVVNYKGINSEMDQLEAYLTILEQNPVSSDWSRNQKLAYWINAYNAFTIKLILDHYPVNSIQEIAGGKPWDLKWIKLGGKTYSLNQIENDIIRPEFNEPRIHFAVNCAAQSCPPLANEAFTADNLDLLLEEQTKAFINNPKYNTIRAGSVKVSKIFDWYGQDFGDITAFINKYSEEQISASTTISYADYNWNLNNK